MKELSYNRLHLGLNARRRRHVMRLTQKELAARMHCSAKAISMIECGSGDLPLNTLLALTRALEWTLPELLHGIESPCAGAEEAL